MNKKYKFMQLGTVEFPSEVDYEGKHNTSSICSKVWSRFHLNIKDKQIILN